MTTARFLSIAVLLAAGCGGPHDPPPQTTSAPQVEEAAPPALPKVHKPQLVFVPIEPENRSSVVTVQRRGRTIETAKPVPPGPPPSHTPGPGDPDYVEDEKPTRL